jgi:hypothetical protein
MSVDPYAKMRVAAWREAVRVLLIQSMAILLIATTTMVALSGRAGLGVLLGGGIGLIANVYLAISLLGKPLLTQQASNILVSWLVKVVMTLSLLWIAMSAKIVPPLSLIAGLFGAMVAHWLAVMFWLSGRR